MSIANNTIQDLPKFVLIESGNVMEIDTTGDNPQNDPLSGEILPKIEKSEVFEKEDFESKTILVPNMLNVIHEDHNYISGSDR